MKQKLDFVTNSSSTAFCVWGFGMPDDAENIPEELMKKAYKMYVESVIKRSPNFVSYEEFLEDPAGYDAYWNLGDLFSQMGLVFEWEPEEAHFYVGISPNQLDENKTIKEELDEAKEKIRELGFEFKDFRYILEVIYE